MRLRHVICPIILCCHLASCGAAPASSTAADKPTLGSITHQNHATVNARAQPYQKTAQRIIEAAMADQEGWDQLAHLTDRIGPRLSGSKNMEAAVTWAQQALVAEGLENVRTEPVMVPHWVRGKESARLVAPFEKPLQILGLGNSVGTRRLRADVLVVKSFDELETIGKKVRGKIVLFNAAMPAYSEETGSGYGEASTYRTRGAARAAEFGAKGVLVRSLTAQSLSTPHTGVTVYKEGGPKIPAAAVTIEDADLMSRLAAKGQRVQVELKMGARMRRDAKSANVIGELVGREKPEEIVLLGAHLDSWDVGQGAHDDGAGCIIMMRAAILLHKLGVKPRRTVRVVLYTNEENGLRGAKSYDQTHTNEIGNHVLAVESDSGSFAPKGFTVQGTQGAVEDAKAVTSLLSQIRPMTAKTGHSGADIGNLGAQGVPALGLWVEGSRYFDYHHTHADTLDKVDPKFLKENTAAIAVLAYLAAEWPWRFGSPPPKTKKK